MTPSSMLSSGMRTTRANLGLPVVGLDTRQADPHIKELLQDPTRLQQAISTHVRMEMETEGTRIEGIKSAPRNTVKIFPDKEESSTIPKEHQVWLQALPGVKLRGE